MKAIYINIGAHFIIISEADNESQEIPSMPGVHRYGINKLQEHLEKLVAKGLSSILLFGVIDSLPKVIVQKSILFLNII